MEEKINASDETAEKGLKRGIKGWQVGFIAMGGIIGSGYFLGTGYAYSEMGPGIILAYALVGFIVFGLMIAYAELLMNLPRTGSFVAYSKEFLGEPAATGIGWSFWANWGAYVPAECLAVGIMLNVFVPGNIFLYSVGALTLLTIINLTGVDIFAKVESALAMTKVFAILVFIVLAAGIAFGLWGNTDGFVGFSQNFGDAGKSFVEQLFPYGPAIVMILLVQVLVNFQGTEIIGVTAAETDDPEKAIPKACRAVVFRVAFLFIVPIALLILLLPYSSAGLDDSIFSVVLKSYGLEPVAWVFSAIVIVAAFSCANTGLYATSRVVYSLAIDGLAPKFLMKLNKRKAPQNAIIFTVIPMWAIVILGYLLPDSAFYAMLLSIAGFTGTVCWLGIMMSQYIFRKRLIKAGYDTDHLKARVKHMWIPIVSMIAQVVGLSFLLADMTQWPVFFLSLACFAVPAAIRIFAKKAGKVRTDIKLPQGELLFEEKYPSKVN